MPSIDGYSKEYLRKSSQMYHIIPLKVLAYVTGTDLKRGLSNEKAASKLETEGANVISPFMKFKCQTLRNIFGPFTIILLIAVMVCFSAYIWKSVHLGTGEDMNYVYYGCILLFITVVNSISFAYQSNSETEVLENFKVLWPKFAHVIREGMKQEIPAAQLVRGDLVEIYAGEVLPADIRLLRANNLMVDNFVITGDPHPEKRGTKSTNASPLKSENMALYGTSCVDGYGRGIVVNTGNNTILGRIENLMGELNETITPPLAREIGRFETFLYYFVFFFTTAVVIYTASKTYGWWDMFIIWVVTIVGNVPSGLIPALGVILVIYAKRLATKHCILKTLMHLDTLGLTSALCINKTGILASRRTRVSHLWMDDILYDVKDIDHKDGHPVYNATNSWPQFSAAANLCHSAYYIPKANRSYNHHTFNRKYIGDKYDVAILKFMKNNSFDVRNLQESNIKVFENPFNSNIGYSVTINEMIHDVDFTMIVKGAPEMLFDRCSTILLDGSTVEITQNISDSFHAALNSIATSAEAALGLCDYVLSRSEYPNRTSIQTANISLPTQGMRFLGMITFTQEAKETVGEIVNVCRKGGIKVILITGAHPALARTLAEKCKVTTLPESVDYAIVKHSNLVKKIFNERHKTAIVSGTAFETMTSNDLETLLDCHEEVVFARMSPHQRYAVINALQKLGHTVAATGNNFGDSVSIKKADIAGIALGNCESNVILESANIILLDENLATVVEGIEMGRQVYYNIKKALTFSMSVHVPETLPFFINLWLGLPMPQYSEALLFVNVGIDLWPAIFIGLEKSEGMMLRLPRPRKTDRLVSWNLVKRTYLRVGVIHAIAGYLANIIVLADNGFLPNMLVGSQKRWSSKAINDFQDSYGQEWTFAARKQMENLGQTAFFIAIVMIQLFNAQSCRTFEKSIIQVGFRNWYLNYSLIFSIILAIATMYTPYVRDFLHLFPLNWTTWLIGVPFGVLLIILDEIRRYFIRTLPPGSWIERETYC